MATIREWSKSRYREYESVIQGPHRMRSRLFWARLSQSEKVKTADLCGLMQKRFPFFSVHREDPMMEVVRLTWRATRRPRLFEMQVDYRRVSECDKSMNVTIDWKAIERVKRVLRRGAKAHKLSEIILAYGRCLSRSERRDGDGA